MQHVSRPATCYVSGKWCRSIESTGMCDIEIRQLWQLLTVTSRSTTRPVVSQRHVQVCLRNTVWLVGDSGALDADRPPRSRSVKQPLTWLMSISVGVIAFRRQLAIASLLRRRLTNHNRDLTKPTQLLHFDCTLLVRLFFVAFITRNIF